MIKIISRFLLFICVFSFLLPLPHFAAAEAEELIRNGGFEDSANMKSDWDMMVGEVIEWSRKDPETEQPGPIYGWSQITNEMASAEGGYAAKLTNTIRKNDVYVRQDLKLKDGMVPGVTYEFSYRIYLPEDIGEDGVKAGVGAWLTPCENDNQNSNITTHQIKYSEGLTNGVWTEVKGQFVFPSNAKRLRILMRCYAVGTVYFDDISLKAVEAEKFEYNTSHVFHYTTEEQGTAKVSILPYYQTGDNKLDTNKVYVNFGIYDEERYITGQDQVPFTNFEASYTYSVDHLTVLQHKYTLKITVYENGKEEDSYAQSLYKYERPRFLDEDGNFRNKWGEIVNPFNAWHLSEEHFDEAAQAGFTTFTMVYDYRKPERDVEAYLTKAENAGLIGLYTLYGEDGEWPVGYEARTLKDGEDKAKKDAEKKAETKEIVEKYKDDKRFLGWVVKDEPLGGGIAEERKALLEESYKFIRDLDPNHPIILTDYTMAACKETVKYCDIFIPNFYGKGVSDVRTDVEDTLKYANGKPVYPNIAAYATSLDKLPSGQQVQHFIHQAFLGGSKGVSVYAFSDSVNNGEKGSAKVEIPIFKTPIWEPLVDTGNTEVPVLFDLFVQGKEKSEEKIGNYYVQRKWTRTDGDYYFLMSTNKDNGATVEYEVGEGKAVKLLGGDSTKYFTLSEGKLSVSLGAFDVLMFKVFDVSTEAQITASDGIGIKYTQKGYLTYKVPTGAERFVIALYKEVDGVETLDWIWWETDKNELKDSFILKGEEYEYTIKLFAWDSALKPLGRAAVVPPKPKT